MDKDSDTMPGWPEGVAPVGYAWHTLQRGTGIQVSVDPETGVGVDVHLVSGGLLTPVPRPGLGYDEWGEALTEEDWDRGLTVMLAAFGPRVPEAFTVVLRLHRFQRVTRYADLMAYKALVHQEPAPSVWWWLPGPRASLDPYDAAELDLIADVRWMEPLEWNPGDLTWGPVRSADVEGSLKALVVPSLWMPCYRMATRSERLRMVTELRDLVETARRDDVLVLADTVEAPEQIPAWRALGPYVPVGWFAEPIAATDLGDTPPGLL